MLSETQVVAPVEYKQTRFTGFHFDSCDKGWLDTGHHSEF